MQEKEWIFPDPAPPVRGLVDPLPPPLDGILARRGFPDQVSVEKFLSPRLRDLSDPFLLPQMEEAVDRILAAVDAGERVVLYGDYDADGITSVAVVTRVLRAYGIDPGRFLPHRIEEGYGMSSAGVARCVNEHDPSLVIALDCGTSSAEQIAGLHRQGIDVLVFDHHEIKCKLPRCPTVNPMAGDHFRYLCTAGIAFKLGHALIKKRPLPDFDLKSCLDLVAIGTVADIAPLREDNRIMVARGLAELARTRWEGLRQLIKVSGVRAPFSSADLGFRFGPRLNAAGRLGAASASIDLLLCDEPLRARQLARELDAINRDRQALEQSLADELLERIQSRFGADPGPAIVLGEEGWHPGLLGIVAARISRKFHRPAILVGFDREGNGKGSGRGIPGVSLVDALSRCSGHLTAFGGHDQACGLSVSRDRFEVFREKFLLELRRQTERSPVPSIQLDGLLDFSGCTISFLAAHERLQPYGTQNPQPVFFAAGAVPVKAPRLVGEKHVSLTLSQNGGWHRAIFFNRTPEQLPVPPWDVAFRIAPNDFRGEREVSIQVEDLRTSRPAQ